MKRSNLNRREFIGALGVAGGLSLLGGSSVDAQKTALLPRRCRDAGAIIRKNIRNLTASELAAFRNGVQVMKARAATDPTSWSYQAAIHGTNAAGALTAWNTCQHNTTHFFSWHRMYLCFFERILRRASGNPNFGLPYWNYSDTTDLNARYLPAAFRTAAMSPPASNSLWTTNRGAAMNNGTGQLPTSGVSLASAIPGPVPFYTFSSNVNSTPHLSPHVNMGGWMTSVPTAAQDPIFWLHHCNIDRLWNRWLAGGGGRSNPPAFDTAWNQTLFTFFDEFGNQVQMKGEDLVRGINCFCRSCYDEEAVYIIWEVFDPGFRLREIVIGTYKVRLNLDTKRLRFAIELDDRADNAFDRASKAQKAEDESHFNLNFEGVEIDKTPEFYYEVYVNLPDSVTDPNYKMDEYAGNLGFFGAEQKHAKHHDEKAEVRIRVPMSMAIKRLKNAAALRNLTVTLVPTGLVDKNDRRLPIRSDAKVSIERVTLTVDQPEK